jgi:DNA polymerase III subunit epsilon
MFYMPVSELFTKPISDLTFAVVDTETTGMNPQFSRVMDIGIILMRNGEVLDKWETLIDSCQDVPFWISKYTHLTYDMVKGLPAFKSYIPKIQSLLKGTIFVGHNVMFDYSFLYHEMKREGADFNYPKLCTVMLGRKLLPQLANAHLDALADYYQIKISQRHRALPDAEATAIVLSEFIKIAREKYSAKTFFDLERLQRLYIDKRVVGVDGGLFN